MSSTGIGAGTALLHYTLNEKIGEGGMGAVWRATDTTLNRDVAIKLLPQIFADSPERLARFEREAKLLASLNHPNIAAIYGLHQAGDARFLAMELVEGEDLGRRLQQGRLTIDRALDVALQMATGIEAAHEKGVVHRDLKPANVIVTPEGRVKLLDFGLAKAMENDPAGSDPSLSPTMTSAGTVAGMILGTAAYMSPEQARGKPLDRRTDLWSFGCVVYECLTGVRLFDGETVSDSLAAILRKEPNWSRLPDDTPPMVRLLLRRCLTRDAGKRIKDAGDARIEIEQAIEDPRIEALGLTSGVEARAHQPVGTRRLPWALAALAIVVATFFAFRGLAPAPQDATSYRLTIPVPGAIQFGDEGGSPPVISPDGRLVVYGATNENQQTLLWLRPLDGFEARPLSGTENAQYAFWSPDSKHVGFFMGGKLKRVEVDSGRIQPIGGEGANYPRGASWHSNGKVLFAPDSNSGIHVMNTSGGALRQITTPDPDVTDSSHRWPQFLPDGEHFLFLSWTNDLSALEEHGGVYLSSLSGDTPPVRVVSDASSVAYVPPGYLLVMREDSLIAVPFDVDQGRVTGEGVVIASGVLHNRSSGHSAFSASRNGTLVYARGQAFLPAELIWYDRSGQTTPAGVEPVPFSDMRLSPDATRAAAAIPGANGDNELWMIDLVRGVRTRLASAPWSFNNPRWSAARDVVMYTSQELGRNDVFSRRADGSGDPQPVVVDDVDKDLHDWSRDGKNVVYWPIGTGTNTPDLWIYSIERQQSEMLIAGQPAYTDARFSPDASHVVYQSDDSGRMEVFVQQIDDGARWQVSTTGGTRPHWRDDGKEIVYVDPDRRMMAVSVEVQPNGLTLGKPRELFAIQGVIVVGDATCDHERFLVATRTRVEAEPLHVILNWHADL